MTQPLRPMAKQYVAQKDLLTKPPQTSVLRGSLALIFRCDRCTNCTTAWRFTGWYSPEASSPTPMKVEKTGNCTANFNLKRIKRDNAKKYHTVGNKLFWDVQSKVKTDLSSSSHQAAYPHIPSVNPPTRGALLLSNPSFTEDVVCQDGDCRNG